MPQVLQPPFHHSGAQVPFVPSTGPQAALHAQVIHRMQLGTARPSSGYRAGPAPSTVTSHQGPCALRPCSVASSCQAAPGAPATARPTGSRGRCFWGAGSSAEPPGARLSSRKVTLQCSQVKLGAKSIRLFVVSALWLAIGAGQTLLHPSSAEQDEAITTALQGAVNSRRTGEAANDGESSIEADVNASHTQTTTETSTASTTTSISLLAARVLGHFEFVADELDDDAVEYASEVSLSEALRVAAWQLNVSVVSTDSWHVSYTVDLGTEFRDVLVAGHQVMVDSSGFAALLSQELAARSASPQRVRASFDLRAFARLQIQGIDPAVLNSTSTTVTSLTQTTTTTTRTILVSLKLLSAIVREPFDSVVLAFNLPARFGFAVDRSGCSPDAFSSRTWESLGHPQSCRWRNETELEVMFGRGATLQLGQVLVTSPAGFEPTGNVAYLDAPALQVRMEAEGTGQVTPRLSHPTAVQACSRVSFSTLGSTGGKGRPLQVKWFLGPPIFRVVREALQAMVDMANSEDSRILEFPPANFSVAVQEVRVVLGEISYAKIPVHVNVTAQVSNWLGAASNISGMVTVLKEEEALPVLVPSSPSIQHVKTQDETVFSIMTLSNKLAECVRPLNTTSLNVVVEWEYRPDPGRVWHRLGTLQNLTDISKTPNSIRFAPFTFPPNTAHQFRVFVQYEGTSPMRRPNVTFNLSVASRQPPTAIIRGPSEVGAGCPFFVNASRSRDGWSLDAELAYTWSCRPLEGTGSCNLPNFADANFSRTDGTGASGMLMHGLYIIGLSVRRQSESPADAGNATVELRVVAGARPPISIEVPWENEAGVSVASDALMVTAHADQTQGCLVPETWASRFLLVEHGAPFPVLASLSFFTTTSTTTSTTTTQTTTTSTTTSSTTATSTTTYTVFENESMNESMNASENASDPDLEDDEEEVEFEEHNETSADWQDVSGEYVIEEPKRLMFATRDFHGSLLIPGTMYSYAFIFADALELAALEENDTWDLSSVSGMESVAFAVSVPFRADSPPSRGRVIVTPLQGHALQTPFRIATADWEDEDEELEYAFYRFPIPGSGGTSSHGLESRFDMPDIEWKNASHTSHWRKQGGVLLRSFSAVKTLEELRLPVGSYFVVVRARDSANGMHTEFLAAPRVFEPPTGVNEASLIELLDSAQSSNDANSIINAVDTVISSLPTSSEETSQLSLQLILQATALIDSAEVAVKCVEAVTAVLVGASSDGTAEGDTLQSASAAIDFALDAMSTVGMVSDAGALVLEGISTVGATSSRNVQNREAASRLTGRVKSLTTKLADRLLSQLAQGRMELLRADDAAGTGGSSSLKVARIGSSTARRLASATSCADASETIELSTLQVTQPLLASEDATPSLPVSGPAVEFQDAVWRSTNLYNWANPALGVNAHVPADATVRSFAATACGSPVVLFNLSAPLYIRLRLPQPGAPPSGYFLTPACAKWHEADTAWKMDDLQVQDVDATHLTCISFAGTGVYTAFFSPTPEPTSTSTSSTVSMTTSTSTSATRTSSTATGPLTTTASSVTVTVTTVVWWATAITTLGMDVPFCSESSMPPSPPGAAPFTCYGPRRVGQECRAKCDPDPLNTDAAAISCLPGLTWAFSERCPSPTEFPLVVTTETPTTNYEVMTVYGMIALGILGFCLCAALGCSLASHLRSAGEQKPSRVAPELPQKPSDVSARSLTSAQIVSRMESDQLLFQTWAVESAKHLPSPTFRERSSEPTQPDRPSTELPPADAADLRTLTVEGGFWDWAKEWSHASIVQVAMPDPATQLVAVEQPLDADAQEDGEEAELEEDDETVQALFLQNIGSDAEEPGPKALTM
ncbi:unnamed protein product [Symbiodinium sp. CCMP2592]|nr:unnamed protein product [Symbiodinium sp. CCMP2592]